MKLSEVKTATKNFRLVDLDHSNEIGKLAYRMGFERNANPYKVGSGHDAWQRGWDHAKRGWEDLLRRNGADGVRLKLWMA